MPRSPSVGIMGVSGCERTTLCEREAHANVSIAYLNLVDRRGLKAGFSNLFQMPHTAAEARANMMSIQRTSLKGEGHVQVGDADCAQLPLVPRLDQCSSGFQPTLFAGKRTVKKHQVDVV